MTFNSDNKQHDSVSKKTEKSFEIAVIGGGIVGLMVAIGLLKRGINVSVFEQAAELTEVSAGFAFTGVARECMKRLDPRLLEALDRIGEVNRHPYNRYWDGYNPSTQEEAESNDSLLFEVSARDLDYQGCLRSHLLHEMASMLPARTIKLGKQLKELQDNTGSDKVTVTFSDQSTYEVDGVIGCDGVRSRTRQLLAGLNSLSSQAHFAHKVAYRAVVPIADAVAAFGNDKGMNQSTHMGPGVAIVSYPIAQWTYFNIAVFVHEAEEWKSEKMTAPATRNELIRHLSDWSPSIQSIVQAMPEKLTKWALFDTADYPVSTYAKGRVCIAGDAAHATTPFLGAGACMGVEDALVLATTLDLALDHINEEGAQTSIKAISAAFQAYSTVRLVRSQWLVQGSRDIGDLYQWRNPKTGRNSHKCKDELVEHQRRIWDFNVNDMVTEAGLSFLSLCT
ncbi:salicylate 1-monooxygenase [Fusarium subglutinans]|uniref:Salicylate 1-monooxygenase n=1 Tax=Gibberella subglutinans TaxID=42677 RepID=A0A8H5KI76_GIBSU|nr:salicylate 1-monooxygenase [Fusarium subglutinans]KAF5573778.1 salicylate 1-monooxygenase [Fusarium subglutinans]